MQSPFHAYYLTRKLESLPDEDKLLPVFASSDIKIYPFQIAAANFALRSPYIKDASEQLTDVQQEEIDRIKLRAKGGKNALAHELDDLQRQINSLEQVLTASKSDRMKVLSLEKRTAALKQDFLRKQESQFFEEMQLDV